MNYDSANPRHREIQDGLKVWTDEGITLHTPYDPNRTPDEFSAEACDCCRTHLAGERHPANAYELESGEWHEIAVCPECLQVIANDEWPNHSHPDQLSNLPF